MRLLITSLVFMAGCSATHSRRGDVPPAPIHAMDDDSFYYKLARPREVERREMPDALRRFYRNHEGIGLESPSSHVVRLARLDEVRRITWTDLHILGDEDPPHDGWKSFSAWRIGYSDMLDEIVYVVHAPGVSAGSVLAAGIGVMLGPPGDDEEGPEGAIVVAGSFEDWIKRVEQHGPVAHGLFVHEDLSDDAAEQLRAELARLNRYSDYSR